MAGHVVYQLDCVLLVLCCVALARLADPSSDALLRDVDVYLHQPTRSLQLIVQALMMPLLNALLRSLAEQSSSGQS